MSKSIFFSIEEILNELFFNDVDISIKLLKDYGLFDVVESNLTYLKNKGEKDTQKVFTTLTISFLQTVNTSLHSIEDLSLRNKLKYILANIGNYIIDSFSEYEILTITELKSLRESLISLSEVRGYDFKDIDIHLQLNRLIRKWDDKPKIISNDFQIVYYDWLGSNNKLQEIAQNLYSEGAIKSVKTFKKLFSSEPVSIQINPVKGNFIFVLFDVLYENKFIRPKGKRGKFIPLQQYCVDLQEEVLYKKQPKYINQEIKKQPVVYNKLKGKAENWIK